MEDPYSKYTTTTSEDQGCSWATSILVNLTFWEFEKISKFVQVHVAIYNELIPSKTYFEINQWKTKRNPTCWKKSGLKRKNIYLHKTDPPQQVHWFTLILGNVSQNRPTILIEFQHYVYIYYSNHYIILFYT